MKRIGITGSLASGKSTASNFLSKTEVRFLVRINLLKNFIVQIYSKKNFKN